MKKQSTERSVRREKIRRKKMQVREKVGKSRNTVFFRGFVAPEGWKRGSLKRRVRRHLGRWEMKSCTPLWREAHLEVKCVKNWGVRTTFGSWDVEKAHAVVARSTFPSQNVQNTPFSDHFWKLRWRGAKHVSKCYMFAPLLEVQMSKKRTPLWREAHFEVKMYKTLGVRTTFGGSDVASPLRFTTLDYVTVHHTPLHYITLHYTPQHYNYNYTTRLHSTTLNFTTLHYARLHYIKLHYTPLHYTTLHNTTTTTTQLHSTTLHYTPLHYITLHYLPLHFTTLHYTPLQLQLRLHNYTPLHEITLHYTTLHYTTLHSTTLRYTTLHYTTIHWMTLHHR